MRCANSKRWGRSVTTSSYGESVEQVGDHCWLYGYWISYYYRIWCIVFKIIPGRSQNLQRSTKHMVNIFHESTNPADGYEHYWPKDDCIGVFLNHTIIEYWMQNLRTNMQVSDLDMQYSTYRSNIQYSIFRSQYPNINISISISLYAYIAYSI